MGVRLDWLVDAARLAASGTGKQVIVSPGWLGRGQGLLRVTEIVVGHHTATPDSAPGDYPSRNVVTYGRAGLEGLLSQLGLGRSGNIYVMGAGLAWHAGASAYAGFYDLNDEAIGIEAEDDGDGHWTAAQLMMYPRLVGALLHYMRRGTDRYASHRTVAVPRGRKPDPAGISDAWMRAQAAAFMRTIGAPGGGGAAPGTPRSSLLLEENMSHRLHACERGTLALGVPERDVALQFQIAGAHGTPGSELRVHRITFLDGSGNPRPLEIGNSLVEAGDPWWNSHNWLAAKNHETSVIIEFSHTGPGADTVHGATVSWRRNYQN